MFPDRRRGHLPSATLLDLIEDRLDPARRRAAEAHLGLPCAACRERLLSLASLTGRMRAGRMEEVPEPLRRAAIEAFAPPAAEPGAAAAAWRTLALAFDSFATPLPAAVRRAVGEARRLRFELAGTALEVEHEPESADQCALRGRLAVADPELHRVEVVAGAERFHRWADAEGAFAFEGLPRGACRLAVSGPAGRFETPAFET